MTKTSINQPTTINKKNPIINDILLWIGLIAVTIIIMIDLVNDAWVWGLISKYRYHIPVALGGLYGYFTGEGDVFELLRRVAIYMMLALLLFSPLFLLP